MKRYLQNGLIKDNLKESFTGFYLLKKDESVYFDDYDNFTEIELAFRDLGENILQLIFPNTDEYYSKISSIPTMIMNAGLNSDSALSKELFSSEILKINDFRFLYYADLISLLCSIADRVIFMRKSFIDFYINFCEIEIPNFEKNSTEYDGWTAGEEITQIFNSLHGYFINTYSLFDLTTKLVYELENFDNDFTKYKKRKSGRILFGDKKRLKTMNIENTIFANSNSVKIIETLRHELIHNGSWEDIPKVFFQFKNSELINKWIHFPDFDGNKIITFCNRKRFFSQANKINEILPNIMRDINSLLNNTINEIKKLTTTHYTR